MSRERGHSYSAGLDTQEISYSPDPLPAPKEQEWNVYLAEARRTSERVKTLSLKQMPAATARLSFHYSGLHARRKLHAAGELYAGRKFENARF